MIFFFFNSNEICTNKRNKLSWFPWQGKGISTNEDILQKCSSTFSDLLAIDIESHHAETTLHFACRPPFSCQFCVTASKVGSSYGQCIAKSCREKYLQKENKCVKEERRKLPVKLNSLNRFKEIFCYLQFSVFLYKLLILDTK